MTALFIRKTRKFGWDRIRTVREAEVWNLPAPYVPVSAVNKTSNYHNIFGRSPKQITLYSLKIPYLL